MGFILWCTDTWISRLFLKCLVVVPWPIASNYISVVGKIKCVGSMYKSVANKVCNKITVHLFILLYSTCRPIRARSSTSLGLEYVPAHWHGYVLHEGITYKSRVPRTSRMTSRLLRHTAAVMRAHSVLCNSYNTRPLLFARITCYVTVIM
jgi:hypothetical protein